MCWAREPRQVADITREAGLAYGMAGLVRALPFHNNRHKLYLPLDLLSALELTPEEFFHLEQGDPRLIAADAAGRPEGARSFHGGAQAPARRGAGRRSCRRRWCRFICAR